MQTKQNVLIDAATLACLISSSNSHIEDIDTGISEGIYDVADNEDLGAKRAAVNAAQFAYQAVEPIFRIRNFGNNTACDSIESLSSTIQTYRGKSVAIDDLRHGGGIHYVDVLPNGDIYESYGSRPQFEIELRLKK